MALQLGHPADGWSVSKSSNSSKRGSSEKAYIIFFMSAGGILTPCDWASSTYKAAPES